MHLPFRFLTGGAVLTGLAACAGASFDPAPASSPQVISFAASDFAFSGANPAGRPDALALVRGRTDAASVEVRATTTNAYQGIVSVLLDGQPYRALVVPRGPNTLSFTLSGLGVGTHELAFNIGEQFRDQEQGEVYFQTVQLVLPAAAHWATTAPVRHPAEGIDILGDSNSMGVGTTEPGTKAYPVLLRARRPAADVVASGYSGLIGYEHLKTAALRATEIARAQERLAGHAVQRFVLAVGTNDYIFARCTAAEFGSALTAFLPELRAALPGVVLYVQTPPARPAGEGTNAKGSTLDDYRRAATAAAQAAGAKVLAGPLVFKPALVAADGTHYTDAAQRGVAAAYDSVFAK